MGGGGSGQCPGSQVSLAEDVEVVVAVERCPDAEEVLVREHGDAHGVVAPDQVGGEEFVVEVYRLPVDPVVAAVLLHFARFRLTSDGRLALLRARDEFTRWHELRSEPDVVVHARRSQNALYELLLVGTFDFDEGALVVLVALVNGFFESVSNGSTQEVVALILEPLPVKLALVFGRRSCRWRLLEGRVAVSDAELLSTGFSSDDDSGEPCHQ